MSRRARSPRAWLLVLGLAAVPGCELGPVTPSPCGNGVIDPGEACDRDALGGQSCEALVPGTQGVVLCNADCTLFTGLCQRGFCGNGEIDPGEECDDGDVLSGDGCSPACVFEEFPACGNGWLEDGEDCDDGNREDGDGCSASCTWEAGGPCGDGIIQWNEECDGTDLGGHACTDEGFTGGQLACSHHCNLKWSGCLTCGVGEAVCDGACLDVRADPANCGGCGQGCAAGEACVGGACLGTVATWSALTPGPMDASEVATAHGLVSYEDLPVVAWIARSGAARTLRVRRWLPSVPRWAVWDPAAVGDATDLDDAIALATHPVTESPRLLLAYRAVATGARVLWFDFPWWSVLEPPGWDPGPGARIHLELAATEQTTDLLATRPGLGGGPVQHGFRSITWRAHPVSGDVPGQVVAHAAGRPALVHTDRTWVAVAEAERGRTTYSVRSWDHVTESWAGLGDPLDVGEAGGRHGDLALAADADGGLWVAWSRGDDDLPASGSVHVARYDLRSQRWVRVGGGPASAAPGARAPSIAVIGPTIWLAHLDASSGVERVRVRRLDPLADAWVDVGDALNEDPARAAEAPVIAGCGGVPHVAFREAGRLVVKAPSLAASPSL